MPHHPRQTGAPRQLVEFMREVDGPRHDELGATERRIGVTREVFFLAAGGDHDLLVMYLEGRRSGTRWGLHRLTGAVRHVVQGAVRRLYRGRPERSAALEPAELLAAYAAEEVRA